jgi:hypothetical protein
MKKLFGFFASLSFTMFGFAQVTPCGELFISEYVEGSHNNKAIEIYNPTNATIDLSTYRFTRWQNGSATWDRQYSDTLSGSIAPKEVVVLMLDRRDPNGVGVDTALFPELEAKGDLFLSKDYNTSYSMSFNGDDALSLDKYNAQYNTWILVDIFGKIGERPSNPGRSTGSWSDSFPYNNGLGLWYTIDKSLVRKPWVKTGADTLARVKTGVQVLVEQAWNPKYFNPSIEWEIFPRNYFDSLGSHTCNCATASSEQVKIENTVSVYPVPSSDILNVNSITPIRAIRIFSLTGQEFPVVYLNALQTVESKGFKVLDIQNLLNGMYQMKIDLIDGSTIDQRFVK